MEVFGLARPVNVGHLDDHVDGHQTVSFRRPVDAHRVRVIRLSPATAMSQPEMTMGQRVTGHGSSGSTNLSGSRGSRVSTRDPLSHDQVNKIPRTGYFVAVMMLDFGSTST